MLKMILKRNGQDSIYGQLPNHKAKDIWQHLVSFFNRNRAEPKSFTFAVDGKEYSQKPGLHNLRLAIKKTTSIHVSNETKGEKNIRAMEIRICPCETQFVCKCEGSKK